MRKVNLFLDADSIENLLPNLLPLKQLTVILLKKNSRYHYLEYRDKFIYLDWNKIDSFYQVDDRVTAFASELLQKYLLAELVGVQVSELKLKYSDTMRPFIANSMLSGASNALVRSYDYNVSHSREYVCLALYAGNKYRVGIDIEFIDNAVAINELQGIVFSPSEQNLVAGSVPNFFKLWTKKEALIKAIGYGFTNDFFQTTELKLDNIEINPDYIMVSQQFDGYFISICLYNGVNFTHCL